MTRLPFDRVEYQKISDARGAFLRRVLPDLKAVQGLKTAVDAGCGVGFFSCLLEENGFHVTGFDARPENVEEARRRYPAISFETGNVESADVTNLGQFDLVVCFGLLYHLENPFQALRNMYALAKDALLLESMCVPDERPCLVLRDECRDDDQGLNYVAFYPSESALTKMCYKAGFPYVYRFVWLPEHEDFHTSHHSKRRRTVLLAAKTPHDTPALSLLAEPLSGADPWKTAWARVLEPLKRVRRFAGKPWRDKARSLASRWVRAVRWVHRS